MEKELVEAKKKAIKEYKLFNTFFDDVVDKSSGVFHEEFDDCRNKVKELFLDIGAALLIPSITILKSEEAMEMQDIGAGVETLLSTASKAITVAEVLEAPMDAQPEAPTDQVVEI